MVVVVVGVVVVPVSSCQEACHSLRAQESKIPLPSQVMLYYLLTPKEGCPRRLPAGRWEEMCRHPPGGMSGGTMRQETWAGVNPGLRAAQGGWYRAENSK